MNWQQAVAEMSTGKWVNRLSLMEKTFVGETEDGESIYDMGTEPVTLFHAIAHDYSNVKVFVGADTRYPFIPEAEDMNALDWVIVDKI